MIYIIDDFLDKKLFNVINNNLGNFKKISTKDKDFWTIEPFNSL